MRYQFLTSLKSDAKTANLTDEEYTQIESAVNAANTGAVEIRQTKASTKDYFAGLQAGADSKKKTYWYAMKALRQIHDWRSNEAIVAVSYGLNANSLMKLSRG